MTFGTIKMTPEFMAEMDKLNPKGDTRTLQMSVTTDGSDVSREEVEAAVRRMIQNRIDGKCKIMDSYPEEPRERKTVKQYFEDLDRPVLKRVRRGCPNAGQICGCLGVCDDLIEVPLNDPRPAVAP